MMRVSQLENHPVYEPLNDQELAQWRPSEEMLLQFVRVERDEFWIFHAGNFVGCARQLRDLKAWQAVSDERGYCLAPLASPLDCAWRLIEMSHKN